jgi:hypothetical protein
VIADHPNPDDGGAKPAGGTDLVVCRQANHCETKLEQPPMGRSDIEDMETDTSFGQNSHPRIRSFGFLSRRCPAGHAGTSQIILLHQIPANSAARVFPDNAYEG